MLRFLILMLLVTLPLASSWAPAQAADDPPDDMATLGDYPELTRAIATKKYHLVLKHPVVQERLREIAGPHYDRLTSLGNVSPVGYQPSFQLILQGDTADTARKDEALREHVMIVVNWGSGRVWAALRKPDETLIFGARPYLNELPWPMLLFVREKAVDAAVLDKADTEPSESWIRVLDYRDTPPQLWPK